MTTTVSKSCPAFWRGQPLKIWEPHSQLLTATGLQAESKNIYKQLAMFTGRKEETAWGTSEKEEMEPKWMRGRSEIYYNFGISKWNWTNGKHLRCWMNTKVLIHSYHGHHSPYINYVFRALRGHEVRQDVVRRGQSSVAWLEADLELPIVTVKQSSVQLKSHQGPDSHNWERRESLANLQSYFIQCQLHLKSETRSIPSPP